VLKKDVKLQLTNHAKPLVLCVGVFVCTLHIRVCLYCSCVCVRVVVLGTCTHTRVLLEYSSRVLVLAFLVLVLVLVLVFLVLATSLLCVNKGDGVAAVAAASMLRFNAGGHINHSIFWKNLAPQNKCGEPSGSRQKLTRLSLSLLQTL